MSNYHPLLTFFLSALVEVLREGAGEKSVLEGIGFSGLNGALTTAYRLSKYLHNRVLCTVSLHTDIFSSVAFHYSLILQTQDQPLMFIQFIFESYLRNLMDIAKLGRQT